MGLGDAFGGSSLGFEGMGLAFPLGSCPSLKCFFGAGCWTNPGTSFPRLRLDAAPYEPAPPRRPGQRGRPRLKGERLPNLSVVAEDPNTVWKPTKITNWYGSRERMVEIASDTA